MTINTTIGKTYAITTATECTITTTDGITIATCKANKQTYIIAPCLQLIITNDNALVTETFNHATVGLSANSGETADLTNNNTFSGINTFNEQTNFNNKITCVNVHSSNINCGFLSTAPRPQSELTDASCVLPRKASDERYTRYLKLTQAEYTALTTKEDILYITSDTNKIYYATTPLN